MSSQTSCFQTLHSCVYSSQLSFKTLMLMLLGATTKIREFFINEIVSSCGRVKKTKSEEKTQSKITKQLVEKEENLAANAQDKQVETKAELEGGPLLIFIAQMNTN